MDPIQPIGAMVNPQQQTNPLQTYAGILGLQQQRLGVQQAQQQLQTGQYVQQQEQADAQKQQEVMSERQQLQQQIRSGAFGDPESDGFANKLADWSRGNLPLIGNDVAQQALTTQTNKVSLRSSVADLNQKYRTQIGDTLKGFYGSGANSQQINQQLDELARQNPDMAAAVHWAEQLTPHLDSAQGPAKDSALGSIIGEFTGESQQKPSSIDRGGSVQPGSVGPTGAFTPNGAPIEKTLAPQFVTGPSGIPEARGGAYGSAPASGGVTQGPPATASDWSAFNQYQQNLNARVQAANKSLPQLRLADQALSAINAGAGSSTYKSIAEKLQAIGAPQSMVDAVSNGNLAASQLAAKYLFQSALGTLVSSGGSSTNDQVQRALNILPDIDKDPRASHELLQVLTDQGQTDYAEQNALVAARKGGTFNPATWENDWATKVRSGKQSGVPSSQVPSASASGTSDGTKSTSKSGKPIIFRNGRWEYQ